MRIRLFCGSLASIWYTLSKGVDWGLSPPRKYTRSPCATASMLNILKRSMNTMGYVLYKDMYDYAFMPSPAQFATTSQVPSIGPETSTISMEVWALCPAATINFPESVANIVIWDLWVVMVGCCGVSQIFMICNSDARLRGHSPFKWLSLCIHRMHAVRWFRLW